MTIMEVSMLTGFYPNQDDLKQLSHEKNTVLGFWVHRMLQAEFLQAALVTIYDYYEPCTDPAKPLAMKKFVSHATCRDSLGLQEQELYLIVGETSDLWRIKSDYSYVLGRETFLMLWPADGDASKKELRDQLEEFSEYMRTHGCQS
ncbi:complement C3-like isoform X3 [Pongo pygmaeus]|uniref:complement C3-like isoform X3 n=1 Tax=Pongo pygmaeus TaxID=9600 RepID=UPI0023E1AFC9|nr:complement C3-like isoform X3 [Pongo pygmaeus]